MGTAPRHCKTFFCFLIHMIKCSNQDILLFISDWDKPQESSSNAGGSSSQKQILFQLSYKRVSTKSRRHFRRWSRMKLIFLSPVYIHVQSFMWKTYPSIFTSGYEKKIRVLETKYIHKTKFQSRNRSQVWRTSLDSQCIHSSLHTFSQDTELFLAACWILNVLLKK